MTEITTGDKRRPKKKNTKKVAVAKVDLCKKLNGFSKVVCKIEGFIYGFEDLQNTLFVVGLVAFLLLAPIIFFVMKARKE